MNKNKNHNWNLETTQTWIAKEKNLHYNGKLRRTQKNSKKHLAKEFYYNNWELERKTKRIWGREGRGALEKCLRAPPLGVCLQAWRTHYL